MAKNETPKAKIAESDIQWLGNVLDTLRDETGNLPTLETLKAKVSQGTASYNDMILFTLHMRGLHVPVEAHTGSDKEIIYKPFINIGKGKSKKDFYSRSSSKFKEVGSILEELLNEGIEYKKGLVGLSSTSPSLDTFRKNITYLTNRLKEAFPEYSTSIYSLPYAEISGIKGEEEGKGILKIKEAIKQQYYKRNPTGTYTAKKTSATDVLNSFQRSIESALLDNKTAYMSTSSALQQFGLTSQDRSRTDPSHPPIRKALEKSDHMAILQKSIAAVKDPEMKAALYVHMYLETREAAGLEYLVYGEGESYPYYRPREYNSEGDLINNGKIIYSAEGESKKGGTKNYHDINLPDQLSHIFEQRYVDVGKPTTNRLLFPNYSEKTITAAINVEGGLHDLTNTQQVRNVWNRGPITSPKDLRKFVYSYFQTHYVRTDPAQWKLAGLILSGHSASEIGDHYGGTVGAALKSGVRNLQDSRLLLEEFEKDILKFLSDTGQISIEDESAMTSGHLPSLFAKLDKAYNSTTGVSIRTYDTDIVHNSLLIKKLQSHPYNLDKSNIKKVIYRLSELQKYIKQASPLSVLEKVIEENPLFDGNNSPSSLINILDTHEQVIADKLEEEASQRKTQLETVSRPVVAPEDPDIPSEKKSLIDLGTEDIHNKDFNIDDSIFDFSPNKNHLKSLLALIPTAASVLIKPPVVKAAEYISDISEFTVMPTETDYGFDIPPAHKLSEDELLKSMQDASDTIYSEDPVKRAYAERDIQEYADRNLEWAKIGEEREEQQFPSSLTELDYTTPERTRRQQAETLAGVDPLPFRDATDRELGVRQYKKQPPPSSEEIEKRERIIRKDITRKQGEMSKQQKEEDLRNLARQFNELKRESGLTPQFNQ
jgi:hypothetical protein